MTQTAATPDTVHVKVEDLHDGVWTVVEEDDEPVEEAVDGPVLVDSVSCGALAGNAQSGMESAITDGVAAMQKYKVYDIANGITSLLASRGIRVVCDPNVAARGDCAMASIFDSLTHSRIGGTFGSRVTVNVAPNAGCMQENAFFHELVHIVTGLWHKQPIKALDKDWKAEDRVYSCTDVAFEGLNKTAPTTKCECATCLKTTMDDPRCANFDKCPADIVITSAKCVVTGTCSCDVTTGNIDTLSFTGYAKGPPGAEAVLTKTDPGATADCDGWTAAQNIANGFGCARDPDEPARIEWSVSGQSQQICQCNPGGVPAPVIVSLDYLDASKIPQQLAWDMTTVTCP